MDYDRNLDVNYRRQMESIPFKENECNLLKIRKLRRKLIEIIKWGLREAPPPFYNFY